MSPERGDWSVTQLAGEHAGGLVELFERVDCPCFCQYPGFAGDGREWQNRCANERALNRAGLLDDVAAGRLVGVVATREGRVIGYARAAREAELPKIYGGRVYRGLPCFTGERANVWGVSCFLVEPAERRRGVAASLLAGVIEVARAAGASSLEAFPRGARETSDEEQWTGPLDLYERAGFRVVHDFAPYPVLRLELARISDASPKNPS